MKMHRLTLNGGCTNLTVIIEKTFYSILSENIPKDATGNGSFRSGLKARREQAVY
jgi:hypothetical protein